ncbi:hypothetical protein MNBD_GAMMA19-398 [hydrothermal vent metagenome]|uniref:Acid-resistance membrane protein n=1 Tax=hydrothermal vent metagenome TaxID=652676 RepID=A0A3B1A7H1_9ZZZZ
MHTLPMDEIVRSKAGPYTFVIGILLVALGTLAIFLPGVMSLGMALFAAWLLLGAGFLWVVHTYRYASRNLMNWVKPTLLVGVGLLMLIFPASGVAAVGLLLAIYLFLDAFGSFALVWVIRPAKGWGWMAFNGITSFVLAMLLLVGWPATSMWLVGLYVGISLLFDGWALLMISWALRKSA